MDNKQKLEAEIKRIAELQSYGILDTAPEAQYDQITQLASLISGAPYALIGLVDERRHWFKSRIGFDLTEVSREKSICSETFRDKGPTVITDASKNERFKNHDSVTGGLKIRFYAGFPILSASGYALGAICVADRFTRELDQTQIQALEILSQQVGTLFEIRRATFEMRANLIKLGSAAEKVMEAEQVLREFCEITSAVGKGVEWKFKTLIEFGARHLGLEIGLMGLMENGVFTIHHSTGGEHGAPAPGQSYVIDSFQLFQAKDGVVTVNNSSDEKAIQNPIAKLLGVNTWIATPISNDKGRIGALGFGSRRRKDPALTVNDEVFIRVLAEWFSMVIDREDRIKLVAHQQDVLRNSAQMAALGELAAGVAHEINNPLAVINTSVDLLRGLLAAGPKNLREVQQPIERIEATVDRIHRIVKGLKFSSQNASRSDFAPLSVTRFLDDISELTRVRFARSKVGLKIERPKTDLTIECRGVEIGQVLVNLINNAFDAAHAVVGGWVKVLVVDDAESVSFRVSDNGPGIPFEIQERIMQPFFTTKEVGKGTGLGLSISQGIVAQHRGKLYLDRKSVQTCFVVTLPKNQIRD